MYNRLSVLSYIHNYLSSFLCLAVHVVLDSEVVDLRVCLRSADRELAELKADMKKEKKAHDSKNMDLLRRVSWTKKNDNYNNYMSVH